MAADTDTGPSWSDIAGWYDQLLRDGSGAHDTAVACLLGLVPDLTGATVLDVACGQGLATRAVAEAGAAHVVGTDASEAMIALAIRHPDPAGGAVTYVVDDAQRLDAFPPGTFDGVTCQLALMDIPDLAATLAAVHRVLRAGGWFVFVIGHPCVLVPDALPAPRPDGRAAVSITGYFEERFWRSLEPQRRTPRRQPPPHPRHLPERARPGGLHARRRGRAPPRPAARSAAAALRRGAHLLRRAGHPPGLVGAAWLS